MPSDPVISALAIEPIEGWQCIGCGRIDAPRPCVGVCQDRRVRLVPMAEVERLAGRIAELERQADRMRAYLQWVTHIRPSDTGWQRSFLAMQEQARAVLDGLPRG